MRYVRSHGAGATGARRVCLSAIVSQSHTMTPSDGSRNRHSKKTRRGVMIALIERHPFCTQLTRDTHPYDTGRVASTFTVVRRRQQRREALHPELAAGGTSQPPRARLRGGPSVAGWHTSRVLVVRRRHGRSHASPGRQNAASASWLKPPAEFINQNSEPRHQQGGQSKAPGI